MKVLTAEEVGECRLAIRAVALEGKPIVEVCCRPGVEADLHADLRDCLRLSGVTGTSVQSWVRRSKDKHCRTFSYGFFREAWTTHALDWWMSAELDDHTRHWIGGLLFGYTPAAIQVFITEKESEK